MSDEEILAKIAEVKITVDGLRNEVEQWRVHLGSTSEFVMIEIERLIRILNEIKKAMKPTETL